MDATLTISELPYYNLFAIQNSLDSSMLLMTRMKNLDTDAYTAIGGYASDGDGSSMFHSAHFSSSGSPTKIKILAAVRTRISTTISFTPFNITGIYGIL